MGQVERGYAGGSIFWRGRRARDDLSRVRAYARLLGPAGSTRSSVNNVNVRAAEARLLTDRLGDVAAARGRVPAVRHPRAPVGELRRARHPRRAAHGRPAGRRRCGSGGPRHRARSTRRIPDFGGYVVKADSEGQPGPFAYGRSHADGANLLAEALAPFGGRGALAGVRLQPPPGLAGPVHRPGARRVRPLRPAGRAVRRQRGRAGQAARWTSRPGSRSPR